MLHWIQKPRSTFGFCLVASSISILMRSHVFTTPSIMLFKMNWLNNSLRISSIVSVRKGSMSASVWNLLKSLFSLLAKKLCFDFGRDCQDSATSVTLSPAFCACSAKTSSSTQQ